MSAASRGTAPTHTPQATAPMRRKAQVAVEKNVLLATQPYMFGQKLRMPRKGASMPLSLAECTYDGTVGFKIADHPTSAKVKKS